MKQPRQRFTTNPFTASGFHVPTGKKSVPIELPGGGYGLVNRENGEMNEARLSIHRKVDSDQFVKIFVAELPWLGGLGPHGTRSLAVLLHSLSTSLHSTDTVDITKYQLFEFLEKIPEEKRRGYSVTSLSRGIAELEERQLIARHVQPGRFWIDPSKIFNGDRLKVEKTWERSDRENVVDFSRAAAVRD